MRLIGACLVLCLALAVLKAAVTLVAIVVIAMVIASAIVRPGETVGCILTFVMLGAIGQYPLAGLLVVGGLIALGLLHRRRE